MVEALLTFQASLGFLTALFRSEGWKGGKEEAIFLFVCWFYFHSLAVCSR